jgi:soluble lytic murein transglycosylase-like protein
VCTPSYNGTNLPFPEVKAFLVTASQKQFSRSIPTLRIPLKLLKAIAWQESGWQSAIVACDHGTGTMQVMPATATWLNGVYETSWNINKPSDNVMLGGQYLAWLTKYFGDQLSTYDLNSADTTLLDAVISAYNFGQNAVKLADGKDGIPNWSYVNNVKALMADCPCSKY